MSTFFSSVRVCGIRILGFADQSRRSRRFFPHVRTSGRGRQTWELLIHGWIHEPEEDSLRRHVTIESFRKAMGLERGDAASSIFRQRAVRSWWITSAASGSRSAWATRSTRFGRSQPDGHFRGTVRLSEEEVLRLVPGTQATPRHLSFHAVNRPGDNRCSRGPCSSSVPRVSRSSPTSTTRSRSPRSGTKEPFWPTPSSASSARFPAWPRCIAAGRRRGRSSITFPPARGSYTLRLPAFLGGAGYPVGLSAPQGFRWADTSLFDAVLLAEKTKRQAIETDPGGVSPASVHSRWRFGGTRPGDLRCAGARAP